MLYIADGNVCAQFYNGLSMSFGKNRVQYEDFVWNYYRFDKFDIYLNQQGKDLALYANLFAEKEITRIESILDYKLKKRLIFIVYNTLNDFKQSNIGLITGNDESNIGGITKISKNKASVYFDGNHHNFEVQISEAITTIILNELFNGNKLTQNITNSALTNIPEWFEKGLAAYISGSWDAETEDHVKDGIISGRYEKFNHLTGQDAIYAGHSFWRYIAKTYGESIISNIIYVTKINKNASKGFLYVLGSSLKDLSYEWSGYYYSLYSEEEQKGTFPVKGRVLKRTRQHRAYQQLKVSPSGDYLAYVTNESGKYKIWLRNLTTHKSK